jgi:hypothetical protein
VASQVLPRRIFLRGALGGVGLSIGLPALDIMLDGNGEALAQTGTKLPRRFGVYYWGGGICHKQWVPATTGFNWALNDSHQDFANLRPWTSLVTGTNHKGSSPGHIPARGIALSSSHDLTVCQGNCVGTYRGQSHPEPSIDNIVAEAWKGMTPFEMLAVGIVTGGPYQSNSSWKRGGTAYNRHEMSPSRVFDRLFSGGVPATSGGATQASLALEKSLLDAVSADAKALQGKLGARDKQRLEQHLEGFRGIERRIQAIQMGGGTAKTCAKPTRPVDGGNKEQKAQVMADLLAVAFACDLTRVVSYEWSATQSETSYAEVGFNGRHHELSHGGPGLDMQRITRFIMKGLAMVGEALKKMPEGAGNILDNTLILGTSEHANAAAHDWRDHPFILLGKAGGAIKAGIHHRDGNGGNTNAPRVLLSAIRAVGVNVPQIGQAGRVATDPISEIMA